MGNAVSAPKKRRGKHTLEHNAEARVKTGNATIRAAPAGRSAVLLVPPADCPELPELRASVPTPHGRIEVEIARIEREMTPPRV